ncbi:MAG TPA: DUF2846 domain-containing protein [Candidatus Acidoferrales bacterium]|nr:DUF2846 domain-containing protein [Candidatus Acidoferrales bacterium]
MRPLVSILVLAAPLVFAPNSMAQSGPGCGQTDTKFDVSTTKQRPAAPDIQSGKALVYILQDDLKYNWAPRPTTRFAIDGAWIGATHGSSYFYIFVDPGEHHICANWQSATTGLAWLGPKRSTAATGFTAEAGKTYYFRAQDILHTEQNDNVNTIKPEPEVLLSSLDPDEAQVLMNTFSFSSSHPKK